MKLQNPNIPPPQQAIEIDKAVYLIQMKLDTHLYWLSHSYARAYRHLEKGDRRLYFPEIYVGGEQREYYRPTPDNDKSGMCFFVVAKEETEFEQFQKNFIQWNVGIIFSVNLDLINKALLNNEIFTQNLIRDVREVLTMKLGGLGFRLEIKNVVRELGEIYREFTLKEEEEYLRAPMQGFRFNCTIQMREDCDSWLNPCEALQKNLSKNEKICVLQSIDFSDDDFVNSLSLEQREILKAKL